MLKKPCRNSYCIRNYRPEDLPSYYRLLRCQKTYPHPPSREFLAQKLQRPRFDAGRDLFVALKEARLVGFMELTPEPDVGRVILEGLVHPLHRGRGIGALLWNSCLQRAEELKVKAIHVNLSPHNPAGKVLLRKNFRPVKRFLEMKSSLIQQGRLLNHNQKKLPSFTVRHLQEGEERMLARLQNRCFQESWGYQPNTAEDIAFRLNLNRSSPEEVLLGCINSIPAAYCWTASAPVPGKGKILMLGVSPESRGMGLGKEIIGAGLSHLRDKKVSEVELTVDSDNRRALKLYRSFGFHKCLETIWYELQIK